MQGRGKRALWLVAVALVAALFAALPLYVATALLATAGLFAFMFTNTYRPADRMHLVDQATLDRSVGQPVWAGGAFELEVINRFDRPMRNVTVKIKSTSDAASAAKELPGIWGLPLAPGATRVLTGAWPQSSAGPAAADLEVCLAFEEAAVYRRKTSRA